MAVPIKCSNHRERYIKLLENKVRNQKKELLNQREFHNNKIKDYETELYEFEDKQKQVISNLTKKFEDQREDNMLRVRELEAVYKNTIFRLEQNHEHTVRDLQQSFRKEITEVQNLYYESVKHKEHELLFKNYEMKNEILKLKTLLKIPKNLSMCAFCGSARITQVCSICRHVAYCGNDCQNNHFVEHKLSCINYHK